MGGYLYILFGAVSFCASTVGAICGLGGGVIIKPVLDAFGVISVSAISFLSGGTVLSMSLYSIVKSRLSGESLVDRKIGTPLAIGAAIGGIAGKGIFQSISVMFAEQDIVGAIQAGCLLVITVGTLVYTINKFKIHTRQVKNVATCIAIGLVLGILSAFLGIGGGPINLVVLFYFFSMDMKVAAQNSLYIILFSQITSLLSTLITRTVPEFSLVLLLLMAAGGILGGVCGRVINKKIEESIVDRLFVLLMGVIIGINAYNIYQFVC